MPQIFKTTVHPFHQNRKKKKRKQKVKRTNARTSSSTARFKLFHQSKIKFEKFNICSQIFATIETEVFVKVQQEKRKERKEERKKRSSRRIEGKMAGRRVDSLTLEITCRKTLRHINAENRRCGT